MPTAAASSLLGKAEKSDLWALSCIPLTVTTLLLSQFVTERTATAFRTKTKAQRLITLLPCCACS